MLLIDLQQLPLPVTVFDHLRMGEVLTQHDCDQKVLTVAIIDASELFIGTSDLMLQSSFWSNYEHHNTAKYLVAEMSFTCSVEGYQSSSVNPLGTLLVY